MRISTFTTVVVLLVFSSGTAHALPKGMSSCLSLLRPEMARITYTDIHTSVVYNSAVAAELTKVAAFTGKTTNEVKAIYTDIHTSVVYNSAVAAELTKVAAFTGKTTNEVKAIYTDIFTSVVYDSAVAAELTKISVPNSAAANSNIYFFQLFDR
jgi:allophanate hydrolase subunit 1